MSRRHRHIDWPALLFGIVGAIALVAAIIAAVWVIAAIVVWVATS